eukprot:194754-Chlamydomonas_euryale.AAC.2
MSRDRGGRAKHRQRDKTSLNPCEGGKQRSSAGSSFGTVGFCGAMPSVVHMQAALRGPHAHNAAVTHHGLTLSVHGRLKLGFELPQLVFECIILFIAA